MAGASGPAVEECVKTPLSTLLLVFIRKTRSFLVWMLSEIYFIFHPQKDKSRTGDAQCQSENIQKAIGLVLPECPGK